MEGTFAHKTLFHHYLYYTQLLLQVLVSFPLLVVIYTLYSLIVPLSPLNSLLLGLTKRGKRCPKEDNLGERIWGSKVKKKSGSLLCICITYYFLIKLG